MSALALLPARPRVVAESPALREMLAVVERLAQGTSSVLIQGESGTGKDLLARCLHDLGPRRERPFLKLHCPSLPEELLESELFGHERGAFTDAREAKPGKLELAQDGTVLLDHVEELPPGVQAKLLRVVEERRFERVGGTRTLRIDVRFVATATRDLRQEVEAGRFREDLYHRLGVVPLTIPPLRARRADILPLAEAVLRGLRERTPARRFAPGARELLQAYPWPGNVRELESAVEHAALLSTSADVLRGAFPDHVQDAPATLWEGSTTLPGLKEVEERYIRHVLERVGGRQAEAARVLGISRKALWEKKRRFGID